MADFELPPPVSDDESFVMAKPDDIGTCAGADTMEMEGMQPPKKKLKQQPSLCSARDLPKQKSSLSLLCPTLGRDEQMTRDFNELLMESCPHPGPEAWVTTAGSRGEDVMELFSMPRLVPVCKEMGMLAELSLDLKTGWDCTREDMRALALEAIGVRKPKVIMLSPPCTMYSALQRSMKNRVDPLKSAIRLEEADGFMDFTKDVAVKQAEEGRGFIFEHPASASSWDIDAVQTMMGLPGAQVSKFDQCRYDLRGPGGKLMKKATKLLSNLPQIHAEFHGKTCQCREIGETHEQIQGSLNGVRRSTHAQVYPAAMVQALANCCQEYTGQ